MPVRIGTRMRSMRRRCSFGFFMLCATKVAEERQEPQPEHVERGEARSNQPNRPQYPTAVGAPESVPQNFVFAEEPGKWRRARNRQRGECHRPEGPRNFLSQATHAPHVL